MKIAIFQPMLKQYRVGLFEQLVDKLQQDGHELRIIFGDPPSAHKMRNDNVILNRDYFFYLKSYWFFGGKAHYLQGAISHIIWADLVITEQANKHLFNYFLILLHMIGLKKFAYWGHGKNLQGDAESLKERIKKRLATHCDWWFAYTEGVGQYLSDLGFPSGMITVLNNSVDTSTFLSSLNEITIDDVSVYKRGLHIKDDNRVGLYCGALYPDKIVQFLLDAAVKINDQDPRFILLIGGAGSDQSLVEEYAQKHDCIKYLGPIFGQEKTLVFKSAELFLCPGLVGLAILDAFTAGLPLVTTDITWHSPEIEYLQQDYNGMVTVYDIEAYTSTILAMLNSPDQTAKMSQNATMSSKKFTLEGMSDNFVRGILDFKGHFGL